MPRSELYVLSSPSSSVGRTGASRRASEIASEIARATIAFKAPIAIGDAADSKDKLTIDLVFQKGNLKDVTLRIAWGKLLLNAPIQVPISAS